ncbi:CocE/NonD family hydrolase [Mycobacterium sp. PS03-16]|uniref:CocE/NonD family hydrolase n=1 Tax=Mycobacterium sp. PS03-16 TaxID=2559611 RepID=UPI0010746D39|nr:CocE/NonD family hydrolase [Mycobacterium sp. PS03-16]TFV57989.1 CocE/NonD family hydrolase [Mycobacterium sp. PS03-16]
MRLRRLETVRSFSCYVPMRDGVRIAVNVYLPAEASRGTRCPTMLNQTRYYRAMELRQPLRAAMGGRPFHHIPSTARCRRRFLAHGYAWVDVDVRGAGASFGHRLCEWSPDEVRDGAQIVDWIVGQPWSDGTVGAVGSSYSGASAELLLVAGHPAVRAVAPRFSPFDTYTDIAFPGGIHAAWFTETWGRYNAALDRNAPHEVAGWWVRLLVTGVQPVDGDRHRRLRRSALADHRSNYDIDSQARTLTYRDDVAPSDPYHGEGGAELDLIGDPIDESGSINLFSPHNYWHDVEKSGAAVYSYGGWFDGAYPHAAVKRFLTLGGADNRLILGPWSHGGQWRIEPHRDPVKSGFDHEGDLLRFFDHHLRSRDSGLGPHDRIRYFTMGEGRWKTSPSWPPRAVASTYFLSAQRTLDPSPPSTDSGADEYRIDPTVGTGEHSRWRTQVAVGEAVRYPDRAAVDARLLTYTSAPLDAPMEVTGHPVVTVYLAATGRDATLFVYLEDIDDRGRVAIVTEGQLRALHRRLSDAPAPYRQAVPYRTFARDDARALVPGEVAELTFDLIPTSYLFGRGHRIRVALAGVDASHFAIVPRCAPTFAVHRNRHCASRIELPVVPASP